MAGKEKSEKDLIFELLTVAEIPEVGEVEFSDRAKEIIEDLAGKYRESNIYKRSEAIKPDFIREATATEVYEFMCDRVSSAPTLAHSMAAVKILLPTLWEKIQELDNDTD